MNFEWNAKSYMQGYKSLSDCITIMSKDSIDDYLLYYKKQKMS